MNAASVEPQASVAMGSSHSDGNDTTWSRSRRWGVVTLIFAAQLGAVFCLGERHPVAPRAPLPTPPISLGIAWHPELAELIDPTLFALPNRHGFSGLAWAITPRREYVSADWTEPMIWLPLGQEKLGDSFRLLLATAAAPTLLVAEKNEPKITLLKTSPNLPAQSSLQVNSGLAGRALLNPPALPSWPSADTLPPSVVQVLVDAGGYVVSATLLSSSGLNEADHAAVDMVKTIRFEPLPGGGKDRLTRPLRDLTWGKMIFQWQPVAPPNNP
jgi:TonB family protein